MHRFTVSTSSCCLVWMKNLSTDIMNYNMYLYSLQFIV